MIAPEQHEIDLAHQLVLQPDGEFLLGHLGELAEMHLAHRRDQSVEFADALEQRGDRGAVLDVDGGRNGVAVIAG